MSKTLVTTQYGKIQGKQMDGVSVWKGIPYAKSPLGSLRFRPPQPTESWDDIYDATEFGPSAIQPPSEIMDFLGSDTTEPSEDCLNLSIWSPQADDKRRPVMVWIHGGAFLNGTGSSTGYNGTSFATTGDVVVVTINYRLGVLGFLHLGEIGGEEYASSGNCGLLDQVAALKWVKENIENFGGDPENITIFGESAGAMSIGILLGLPAAEGLFNKAILQSGAARNVLPSKTGTRVAGGILAALGIEASEVAKLEKIPIEVLLDVSKNVPLMALGPVLDCVVIPEHPEEAITKGSSKDIPILIGTNKDEYRLFTFFDPAWNGLDEKTIKQYFEKSLRIWPKISDHFQEELTQTLYEELMTFDIFTYPAIWLAEQQIEHKAPVWMYRFDWETPIFNGELKSCHALEIPYVWNRIDQPGVEILLGSSPAPNIAKLMHESWINFARVGNPNTPGVATWGMYELDKRETLIINDESKVVSDPDKQVREIWGSASVMVNQ